MRINFEFSGGYGGLFAKRPLSCDIESEELPEPERTRLLELVHSSGILEGEPMMEEVSKRLRDSFTYRIRIQEKDAVRAFGFDDQSAPLALRPLLGFLTELAVQSRNSTS